MTGVVKALVAGSGFAFVLAVIVNFGEVPVVSLTTAEGFSRASANLALLAIVAILSAREGRST